MDSEGVGQREVPLLGAQRLRAQPEVSLQGLAAPGGEEGRELGVVEWAGGTPVGKVPPCVDGGDVVGLGRGRQSVGREAEEESRLLIVAPVL